VLKQAEKELLKAIMVHNTRVSESQAALAKVEKVSLVRGLRDDPDFLGSTGDKAGDDF